MIKNTIIKSFFFVFLLTFKSFALPQQTDINNAEHIVDDKGIPCLRVNGIENLIYNPAFISIYALQYGGIKDYDPTPYVNKNIDKFKACIEWISSNLKQHNNLWVWLYDFDNNYNDSMIKAPWYSAFGQAVGIESLLLAYATEKKEEYLKQAEKAAESFFVDLDKGGLCFKKGEDIWFEELPMPIHNPTHILNGHMRSLIALKKLHETTKNDRYVDLYKKGLKTLENWMPLFDTGYWLRYDLNPIKEEICFRFNNRFEFQLPEIPIHSISLRDPVTNKESTLVLGSENDAEGKVKMAGNDWKAAVIVDDKTTRSLSPIVPTSYQDESKTQNLVPPHLYFYLNLPSEIDNLRKENFELTVTYKDVVKGNVNLQTKSIAPGNQFADLQNSDLLLTGSGEWRSWKIPLRLQDLGFWVGDSYAQKHFCYLDILGKDSEIILDWSKKAQYYIKLKDKNLEYKNVEAKEYKLPEQKVILGAYSMDKNGVIRSHLESDSSEIINGIWTGKGKVGMPMYSPYTISCQILIPETFYKNTITSFDELTTSDCYKEDGSRWLKNLESTDIKSDPAYKWLIKNAKIVNGALVWCFDFKNVYNDVVSEAPWQSSFAQSYVIQALEKAINDKLSLDSVNFFDLFKKAVKAYDVPILEGGIKSIYKKTNHVFFEEVPQNVHILNAQLTSLVTLDKAGSYIEDNYLSELKKNALDSLHYFYSKYNTGYWLRYDTNPKKDYCFQLDFIEGEKSPEIAEILFVNLDSEKSTSIKIGNKEFKDPCRLSGCDWAQEQDVDGKKVRTFDNGYLKRYQPIEKATFQNSYFFVTLPITRFDEYFDVPVHRIIIHYKDAHKGKFALKMQSISEGNVLKFEPIPHAIFECIGDGQWKEASFDIQPQNMGWFVGPDYQQYKYEQLREIGKRYNDWFTTQEAERHEYFHKTNQELKSPIIEPVKSFKTYKNINDIAKVIDSTPSYPGFEFDKILKNEDGSQYAAAQEDTEFPHFLKFEFDRPVKISKINILWESDENYGKRYSVENELGKILVENNNIFGKNHTLEIINSELSKNLTLKVYETIGQKRLLIRNIQFFEQIQ